VTAVPDIRYARSGDVAIAYQTVGDGPVDLVFVPFIGNIRWTWEQPRFTRFYEQFASFARLILFDKRGTGLSDRPRTLTLESQMDDIRAVLDAVGSDRAALLGAIQGSQLCALFGATYPERTQALLLYHPHAGPSDLPRHALLADEARERWGSWELTVEISQAIMPSLAGDAALRRWWADYQRFAASPGSAAEFFRMLADTDISEVLPTIRVPTLVIHRERWREPARRVTALIPGASIVEVAGRDTPIFVDDEVVPARPSRLPPSATPSGATCSPGTTPSCGARSHGSAGKSSTLRATGSSRRSTGLRGRSAARRRSSPTSASSGSGCGPGCARASASCTTASWRASRSASARGSQRRHSAGRWW
jgi:pimeloyl-ACP methyl ester carboxylesterase